MKGLRLPLYGMVWSASAFATAGAAAQLARPTETIEEFELSQPDSALIVPVRIAGANYRFALDTSLVRSEVDFSLRGRLGREIDRDEPLAGERGDDNPIYEAPAMSLGKLRLRPPIAMACSDFTLKRQVLGEKIDGALGMDVLQELVISIDFDAARVRVLRSAGPWLGAPIRLLRHRGRLFVTATLADGQTAPFWIDTGQNGPLAGTLDARSFARLKQADRLEVIGNAYQSSGAETNKRSVGRTTITLPDAAQQIVAFNSADVNSIGLGYLSRYLVTLDFPDNMIYLRRGQQYNRADSVDLSGMHLLRIGAETLVHSVDAGGPAEVFGVLANDRLLSIDGAATAELTMSDIRARFRTVGERRMLLRRGANTLWVNLLIGRPPSKATSDRRETGRLERQ